jgi:hypothetical protein
MNLEYLFVEVIKDEWYCFVESHNKIITAWNWLNYAVTYGPFVDFEIAHAYISTSNSNFEYSKMEFNHFNKLSNSKKEIYLDLIKFSVK